MKKQIKGWAFLPELKYLKHPETQASVYTSRAWAEEHRICQLEKLVRVTVEWEEEDNERD